ncbi:MAG: flavin prenyltransferase UbiX [Pseudomonadota bacterium]
MLNTSNVKTRITLAITGASGSCYALKLIKELLRHDIVLYLLISDAAKEVFRLEADMHLPEDKNEIIDYFLNLAQLKDKNLESVQAEQLDNAQQQKLFYFGKTEWLSPVASGSNGADAMVICPASMGSLSAIAHGASNNLIERAADVMLKEKKRLIIVPREMPLSTIHLENMLKLSKMGVSILPACPGFYHQPETLDDIVNFVIARILDQLQLKHNLLDRWADNQNS